jgi:dUTP pyrophosphatase
MSVIIVANTPEVIPIYATEHSAGADLFAHIEEEITLESGEWKIIPTGIKIEMENGMEAQIRPRSGLAVKHGVTVLNAPGTIDSDYRGEIMVILINHSKKQFIISRGMRIAQIIFSYCVKVSFSVHNALQETKRGDGGFGSTGC